MLCYTVGQNNITVHLVPGLLLLLPEQGPQRDAGNLGHLQHDTAMGISSAQHRHCGAGASQLGGLVVVPGGGGLEGPHTRCPPADWCALPWGLCWLEANMQLSPGACAAHTMLVQQGAAQTGGSPALAGQMTMHH